ncbi:hypothetical protein DM01DRAFT_1403542 [Hesseltinella vesiculosa]|uniref:RRM domain-containing protein n=1 Tax=Hesseltinella vesiculosa TaxID=101127 RepID=A0A1X2GYS4_9FUNG|nr:hypothetical protein DM01DRAFT_1403542 [Hesseltinella vesiculosa]
MAKSKTQQAAAKTGNKKQTKVAEPTKKTKAAKKVESESEASDDSEDESSEESSAEEEESSAEEEEEEESASDSDAESASDMEEDTEVAGKKHDREDDDEEEEEEEEEEEAPVAKKAKVEVSREEPKQFGGEGLSLFVGQLDFTCNDQDLKKFLEKKGINVAAVRMSRHRHIEGHNRGFAHVDVADEESKEKAMALNGEDFMDRKLRVDDGSAASQRKKDENYSNKSKTVFVANISRDIDENGLRDAFDTYGAIASVRLPTDRETGTIKGFGYIEFENEDDAEKAVKDMNGVRLNGRPIRTDFGGSIDGDREKFRKKTFDGGRGGFRGGRGGGRGDFRGRGRGGRGDFRGRGRGGFRGRGGAN